MHNRPKTPLPETQGAFSQWWIKAQVSNPGPTLYTSYARSPAVVHTGSTSWSPAMHGPHLWHPQDQPAGFLVEWRKTIPTCNSLAPRVRYTQAVSSATLGSLLHQRLTPGPCLAYFFIKILSCCQNLIQNNAFKFCYVEPATLCWIEGNVTLVRQGIGFFILQPRQPE